MNTFWQFLRSEISVVIMHSQAWQMSVTFCCTHSVFLGGGQSQQRKPSSHSQGQNTGAMDTTWKGLQTGCFLQVGGKMTPKFHPHFKRLFFCELGEKAYPGEGVLISVILTKGPTHCLEITPPLPEPEPEHSQSALRLADLTSEEEEGLHGRISQYEKTIDSLLTEVSSLKNEVSWSD